jgi:hypothetical protein
VADLSGRLLAGFGSPEGWVYAGAGTLYQDSDPAGSGQIWRKTTAGGNSGWIELVAGGGGGGGLRHVFRGHGSGSVTISAHSSARLRADVELDDPDNLYSDGNYYAPEAGWYTMTAVVQFGLDTGIQGTLRFTDGLWRLPTQDVNSSVLADAYDGWPVVTVSGIAWLDVGDIWLQFLCNDYPGSLILFGLYVAMVG